MKKIGKCFHKNKIMKKLLFILLLFCSACAVTQTTEKCDKEKKECCSKK